MISECYCLNSLKARESIRCRECGYRIMYKERLRRRADTDAAQRSEAPTADTLLLSGCALIVRQTNSLLLLAAVSCLLAEQRWSTARSERFRSPSAAVAVPTVPAHRALLRFVHAACNRAANERTVLASIVSRMESVAHFPYITKLTSFQIHALPPEFLAAVHAKQATSEVATDCIEH